MVKIVAATAQLVASMGAQLVYSGEFGKKAADILKDLSIKMIPLRDAMRQVASSEACGVPHLLKKDAIFLMGCLLFLEFVAENA